MKGSRRELSIDTVDIFKNSQFTLFPCFTFTPKTGVIVLTLKWKKIPF